MQWTKTEDAQVTGNIAIQDLDAFPVVAAVYFRKPDITTTCNVSYDVETSQIISTSGNEIDSPFYTPQPPHSYFWKSSPELWRAVAARLVENLGAAAAKREELIHSRISMLVDRLEEQRATLQGFLKLKRLFSEGSGGVFAVIMPESEWSSFSEAFGKVFVGHTLVNAGSLAGLDLVRLDGHLRHQSATNTTTSILIRLTAQCPPALMALLVHAARRLPVQEPDHGTMEPSLPPICLWVTPKAYLDFGEARHIVMRSIGYENLAFSGRETRYDRWRSTTL